MITRYDCVLFPIVFVYAHGNLLWSIFLCQGHLLRGLEKLYYKFMIVVLDLWRRMLYGLAAKLRRSILVLARRCWIQLAVGLETNSGLRFYWWTKCVGMGVRGEVGSSQSLLLDTNLIVTCHILCRHRRGCGDRIIAFRQFREVVMKCQYLNLS